MENQKNNHEKRESLGEWGEKVAARQLAQQGYRIVGQRIRIGRDEIDLIAIPTGDRVPQIVFVEVKTRRKDDFGGPIAAVDRRKRHALCRAAARYLRRLSGGARPFRFDVVEVIGFEESPEPPIVRHTTNAFPMERRYIVDWLGRKKQP